ncbi:rhodanese-like domain protein [Carnobacterium sp. 17-4]|uniref:rhodanese-like domain-containing protein n=1 Tax=Carnobacterium sp. (strain 17-4) TaxID=208596 RepID=UPI00020590C1|nr:rhodanese-like domain-containing protein [Carnobacterium sp. 17-4]AEB30899.1 rhodanese-like domain protein [Carnobacterium sp. 17-4]
MYQSITMPEFEQKWKREQIALVDVRELDEWQNKHIEKAIYVPLSDLTRSKEKLDKEQEYYVMCHSGACSAKACQLLATEGYKITNVLGGISAWRGEVTE